MTQRQSCFNCKHFHKETESWEMPNIYYFLCDFRPSNENLRNFPFRNGCKNGWQEAEKKPVGIRAGELSIILAKTGGTTFYPSYTDSAVVSQ